MQVDAALTAWLVSRWESADGLHGGHDDGGLLSRQLAQAQKFDNVRICVPGDDTGKNSGAGLVAVTSDALIVDATLPENTRIQALVPGEHLNDIELSMDDRGRPFVLLILQNPRSETVELLIRPIDESLDAHETMEELYNILENLRASALDALEDDYGPQRKNVGKSKEQISRTRGSLSDEDDEGDETESMRAKKDRRASISLDAMVSLVQQEDDDEPAENVHESPVETSRTRLQSSREASEMSPKPQEVEEEDPLEESMRALASMRISDENSAGTSERIRNQGSSRSSQKPVMPLVSAPSKGATERSVSPPQTPRKADLSSDNLRNIVRAFVKDPKQNCDSTMELLSAQYSYELSCVPTPSRSRVRQSPARNEMPAKKDIKKLKPIIVKMQEQTKLERSEIEKATNVQIQSPHGRSRKMQYIDKDSLLVLSPKEYANRYLNYVNGRPFPGSSESLLEVSQSVDTSSIEKSVDSNQSSLSQRYTKPRRNDNKPAYESATGISPTIARKTSLDEQVQVKSNAPYVGQKSESPCLDDSMEGETMDQALAKAEAELHAKFDSAMNDFIKKKKAIIEKYGQSNKKVQPLPQQYNIQHKAQMPVAAPLTSSYRPSQDQENQDSDNDLTVSKTSKLKTKSSKSNRRKSINFDDLAEFIDQDDAEEGLVPKQPSSTRVMWSAGP